ncbi:hypothetical protein MHYP_G00269180 [Metynnis hypsauchen]
MARNRRSWENRQNPSDSRWSLRRGTSRSALRKSRSPRGFQFEQNASTLTALSGALLPLWCRSTPQKPIVSGTLDEVTPDGTPPLLVLIDGALVYAVRRLLDPRRRGEKRFKMAPVCVAGRLFLLVWLVLLSFGTSHIRSLLVYDRQFLLDLRHSVSDLAVFNHGGQNTLPPLLSGIPTHLYRASASTSQRKRRRRRGKRSGRLVKLKVCLARSWSISRTGHGLSLPFVVSWRFLEPIDTCLVRVVGLDEGVRLRRPCSPRPHQRSVDPRNLRTLLRAPRSAEPQAPAPARISLMNARSLANKTFILRDFFSSRSLDFLCVTETWIGPGDHSALVELLSAGCSYLNSPRTSGRGGGTATVFKNDFKCKQRALSTSISSFEITLFEVGRSDPVLCAVIYRSPKYNKDFINDFSEFLAGLMPNYDRVLIVGDFNIHVCCPEKPLVKDFLNIIDSFNFVQCVFGPTHEHGHTLDLVLSHGLPVTLRSVIVGFLITCLF